MNNWGKITLGEVCDTISTTYKQKNEKIVLINTSDVLNGKVLNHEYVQNVNIKGQFKKTFIKDDILYSEIRPQNRRYAYIDFESNNYVASTKLMVLRYKENVLPKFLYLILSSNNVINNLQAIAETRSGTFPQITYNELSKIEINLPPIDEQKRIADVLSALDDKIEINNKINENLEAQAQAIFKQWFVDEAKEDWEEKPIGYFGNVVCGKTPAKNNKEYFGGEIPFIKIPDMHGNTFVINTNDTLTRLGKLSQENKTLPPYSICVSCIATVGLVSMNIVEVQTNQQINSIIPFKEEYRYYLYLKLSSMYEYLNSIARGGTATLNLNTSSFINIKISLPNEDKLIAFHKIVSPIFNEILNKMKESQNLSEIRDVLLPKLMSGEVRV